MSINKDEIIKMANLSRLKLKEDEIEYFASQMNSILEFVNKLNEVNIENIEQEYTPTFLREDEKRMSMSVEKALLNAPEKRLNMFVVPKIVDN